MPEALARRYRNRSIFGPFVAAGPGQVAALEEEIGRPLPPDYRAFIRVANGGSLRYAVRLPPGPGGETTVFEHFFSLDELPRSYRTLPGTVFAEAFAAWHIPADRLLPIARTGGDSTLFLDMSPGGHGRVLAYVFGLPAWTGLDRDTGIGVVADDFHDYLDDLFIDEETAEWAWSFYVGAEATDPWRPVIEEWLDGGLPGWRNRPWAVH